MWTSYVLALEIQVGQVVKMVVMCCLIKYLSSNFTFLLKQLCPNHIPVQGGGGQLVIVSV